jgi:hypothetical protein
MKQRAQRRQCTPCTFHAMLSVGQTSRCRFLIRFPVFPLCVGFRVGFRVFAACDCSPRTYDAGHRVNKVPISSCSRHTLLGLIGRVLIGAAGLAQTTISDLSLMHLHLIFPSAQCGLGCGFVVLPSCHHAAQGQQLSGSSLPAPVVGSSRSRRRFGSGTRRERAP